MPVCQDCIQPCTCTVSEDGFWGNHPELGRNFTQVEGNGTADNPFVFHFLDQEEFRPRTAEIKWADRVVLSGQTTSLFRLVGDPAPRSFLLYESPTHFVVKEPDVGTYGIDNNSVFGGNYFYVGVTATVAETADSANNIRRMWLTAARGSSFASSVVYVVGGQTTRGGGADPITMTCEGIVPGVFYEIAGFGDIKVELDLFMFQNSGNSLNVTDIRLWVTQI